MVVGTVIFDNVFQSVGGCVKTWASHWERKRLDFTVVGPVGVTKYLVMNWVSSRTNLSVLF